MRTISRTGRNSARSTGRLRRRAGGFTLIEVLVTLVILSVGIVAVLEAFQTSLSALGSARDSLRATLLVQEKMAEIDLQVLVSGTGGPSSSSDRFHEGFFRGFRRDCDAERIEPPGDANPKRALYKAVVSVSREGAGLEQVVATYVGCPVKAR